jgi:hypothetical protein
MRFFARISAPLFAALIVGCSGSTSGQAQPDPAQMLKDAGQALSGVKSVAADVKFGGAAIHVAGLELSSATTKIELPDSSDTTFKVKQGDFLVDARVISVASKVYLKLPFSAFTQLPANEATSIPNLAGLMNGQNGLPSLVAQGRNPRLEGHEKVGSVDTNRISATYTAADVAKLLDNQVKPAGDIHATFWIGSSDHLVRKAVLTGKLGSASETQVEVDLHDFNQTFSIAAPA